MVSFEWVVVVRAGERRDHCSWQKCARAQPVKSSQRPRNLNLDRLPGVARRPRNACVAHAARLTARVDAL
jgi:hypothetical protein